MALRRSSDARVPPTVSAQKTPPTPTPHSAMGAVSAALRPAVQRLP